MPTKKPTPKTSSNPKIASLLIRFGLAGVFAYAAIGAFHNPDAWISYVPDFATKIIAAKTLLDLLSVFQLFLAAWLLLGVYVKYAAAAAIGLLAGIVIFNFDTLLITFRDFGLVTAAAALFFLDDK